MTKKEMQEKLAKLKKNEDLSIDLLFKWQDDIFELKQQLAEYECLMKKYNVEDLGHLDIMLFVLSGETKYQLAQLKQQLTEKEIEDLRNSLKGACQKCHAKCEYLQQQIKESKTEFAIQQLERVKEKFGYKYNFQLMVSSKQMVDFIDQIIKELKKNVED